MANIEKIKKILRLLAQRLNGNDTASNEYKLAQEKYNEIMAKHGLRESDFLGLKPSDARIYRKEWIAQGSQSTPHALQLFCALVAQIYDCQAITTANGCTLLAEIEGNLELARAKLQHGWQRIALDWQTISAFKLLKPKDKPDFTEGFACGFVTVLRETKAKAEREASKEALIKLTKVDSAESEAQALMRLGQLARVAQDEADDTGTIKPEFKSNEAFIIGFQCGLKALINLLKA